MDGSRFDRLVVSLTTIGSRRRFLGGLLAGTLGLLNAQAEQATARKRRCPPCKTRKQGKCKKKLPDGRACAGGTCRSGRCVAAIASPTCAQRCAGCCAGETCQVGTSNGACGTGGAACTTCGGATPLCIDQTCQPCDVCGSGCPFSTVQDAIDLAIAGETIRICAGSYAGNIVIDQSLTLIGAGDGNGAGSTIVRGSGPGSVIQIAAGKTVTLQRLRITGGRGTSLGGGISTEGGTLTVTRCTINDNQAIIGAGIRNNGGTVQLIDSTVSENEAVGPSGSVGGGIDNTFGGMMHLINSVVRDNDAGQGGGINNSFISTVTLDAASRVTGNEATGGPGNGGGIYNYPDSTVTLSSVSNVTGNTPENCAGKTVEMCEG